MTATEYILDNIEEREGHWLWKQKPNNAGYGYARWEGKRIGAHVLAYQTWKGEIPYKWLVDHAKGCPTNCVNPAHLKAVPRAMNRKLVHRRRSGQMSRKDLRISRLLWRMARNGGDWPADIRVPESLRG